MVRAARGEHGKMADLISRGCSPDASDGRGMTPLHYASEAGRAETVTELRNLWPELRLDASDSKRVRENCGSTECDTLQAGFGERGLRRPRLHCCIAIR